MEPDFVLAHEGLGQVAIQERSWKAALHHLEAALKQTRFGGSMLAAVAYVHARAGNPRRARTILKRIARLEARDEVSPVSVALIHAGLKEPDKAFQWLQRAYRRRSGKLIYLKANPIFSLLYWLA